MMTSKKNIYRFFYNATFLVIKRITDVLWNKIRWYRPIERVGKLRVMYFYSFLFFSLLSGEGDTFFSQPRFHSIVSANRKILFFYEYFLFIYKYILIGSCANRSLIFNQWQRWSYFLKKKYCSWRYSIFLFFLIN